MSEFKWILEEVKDVEDVEGLHTEFRLQMKSVEVK